MATSGAFGVERMDGAPTDRRKGAFDIPRLIEGVGVDRDLHPGLVGNGQTGVDHSGRGAPVFVQLERRGTGSQLLPHRFGIHRISLTHQRNVDRPVVERFKHALEIPRARHRGGFGAFGRSGAAADDGGDA